MVCTVLFQAALTNLLPTLLSPHMAGLPSATPVCISRVFPSYKSALRVAEHVVGITIVYSAKRTATICNPLGGQVQLIRDNVRNAVRPTVLGHLSAVQASWCKRAVQVLAVQFRYILIDSGSSPNQAASSCLVILTLHFFSFSSRDSPLKG